MEKGISTRGKMNAKDKKSEWMGSAWRRGKNLSGAGFMGS
jgi:hypothetical protein